MITIPFILLLTIFAFYKDKFIRKHNIKLYILAVIFSLISFILRYKLKLTEPFTQGYLGLAFLYIVMITGALKNKSKLQIKLMSVRREYSIIGFIFISSHGLKYFIEFLDNTRKIEWFGLIPYLIMVPLFITSFLIIRKMFKYQTWKIIQRFAYIAYILIFIHLIIVSKAPNLIVYILLFVPYIVLKIYKEYFLYKRKQLT